MSAPLFPQGLETMTIVNAGGLVAQRAGLPQALRKGWDCNFPACRKIAVLAAMAFLPATSLFAQEPAAPQPAAPDSGWRFTLAPYAWLVGVNGSVAAGGRTVDVNASFIDTLGKTDTLVGLMFHGEARRQQYALYVDVVYAQLAGSPGFAVARNPLPRTTLSLAANGGVTSTLVIAEAGGLYEVWRQDGPGRSGSSIDLLAGVRYWHTATDLSFNTTVGFNAPGVRFDRGGTLATFHSGSLDWADPLIGLQLRQRLAPQHEVRLRGDIGGFGLGSQLSWQLFLAYGYEFSAGTTAWSALLGYRALGVDYQTGGGATARGIDAVLHGPALGVAVKF